MLGATAVVSATFGVRGLRGFLGVATFVAVSAFLARGFLVLVAFVASPATFLARVFLPVLVPAAVSPALALAFLPTFFAPFSAVALLAFAALSVFVAVVVAFALTPGFRPLRFGASLARNDSTLSLASSSTADSLAGVTLCTGSATAPSEILHIPGLGYDGLIGYSPIAMTKNAIGLSIAAEEYGARFFANSANPSGVLEHPGVLKDPRKLRESWNEVYGGTSNSHRVAVLEEGVTFKAISIPPNEAQFLETRKFQINEICRIFRVPPHMVADLEKSSFSNIEQQSLDFIVNTIRPWLVRIEQSICQKLLSVNEKGVYFVKFNVDGMLRGDFASRMNGYAIARQNGWMSTNDIRELEDMNKIPAELGGDRYLCNGNMVDLTNAGVWTQTGGKTENE